MFIILVEECEGDGYGLVFGEHFVQPEYIIPEEYQPERRAGLWEEKRSPYWAKLDYPGRDEQEACKIFSVLDTSILRLRYL